MTPKEGQHHAFVDHARKLLDGGNILTVATIFLTDF